MAAVAVGVLGGCGHTQRLERVRDIPGVHSADKNSPPGWNGAAVVIAKFDDDRPTEFYRAKHNRVKIEHPEHSRSFNDKHVTRVGELDEELPALLARAMPPGARVQTDTTPDPTAFAVHGKLLQSTLESRTSLALAFPGLVGTPWGFHRYRFRVAIEVTTPTGLTLWQKTYEYERKGVEGFYYGTYRARDLAKAALRDTVSDAAADISRVIGQARAT